MILITCDKLESSVYPRVVKMKFIVRVLQSLITILKPHNAVELIIDEELLAQGGGGYLLCWGTQGCAIFLGILFAQKF